MQAKGKIMTTIYLTRHGETEENASRILQGLLPTRLSSVGIKQAHALKDKLADTKFDAILCSDLIRSEETAKIVALPHRQEPIPTRLIQERDWGSLSGKYVPDIQGKEFPSDVETVEAMFTRAKRFLEMVVQTYPDKTILVVGHGLMDRVIMASLEGKTIKDIPPFANTEVRIIHVSTEQITVPEKHEDTHADN